jgi:hypothetical protein
MPVAMSKTTLMTLSQQFCLGYAPMTMLEVTLHLVTLPAIHGNTYNYIYDYARGYVPRLRQQTIFMVYCTHKKCHQDFGKLDDTQKITLLTVCIFSPTIPRSSLPNTSVYKT